MSTADVQAWLDRAAAAVDRGDLPEAERAALEAVSAQPTSAAAHNLKGVILAARGRGDVAAQAFAMAADLDPTDPEPLRNLSALQLSRQVWGEAIAAARKLVALAPHDADAHHRLGAAAAGVGRLAQAEARLRVAVALDSSRIEAWVDLVRVIEIDRPLLAQAEIEAAVAANPEDARLAALRAEVTEWSAVIVAQESRPHHPDLALRRLDLAMRRLEAFKDEGWSPGRSEGAKLQAGHDAIIAALDAGVAPTQLPHLAVPILARLLAWDQIDRIGDFEALGRAGAESGDARNFLMQLPRAGRSRADRLSLLAQHRRWGEGVEARAARSPITPATRPRGSKIRLGLMSSDLRNHVVGAFAWPLFEHLDRDRFEVFVYSFFPGPADDNQRAIAGQVSAFRHAPSADADEAARLIAADAPDVLFELGGSTGWNKVEVMARRLAPVQGSWMGYPHSLGLSTVDYMLVDPYLAPLDSALMLERPLVAPKSFITMGGHFFRDEPAPSPAPPALRNDFVTFGSANSPYKYSPLCLDLWAQVLAATPGSRFLVVRPETDAPALRVRMERAFAARGVSPERLRFEAVRGQHLPFYDEMDISLDTVPLTGGTTTCESLWMGVPVVSLVGEALYERLSYSILANAGLADLAVETEAAYVAKAAELAADLPRLSALRRDLREMIRGGPLGDVEGFAGAFYDLVAGIASGN